MSNLFARLRSSLSAATVTAGLTFLMLVQSLGFARAQDIAIPVSVQFPLLLKILQFEKNLQSRAGDSIVVGVVYQGRFRSSLRTKEEMMVAGATGNPSILNLPVRLVELDIEQVELATMIDSLHVDVIYVTPLRAVDVHVITAVTRGHGVTSMTGVEDYVRSGVSVGIGIRQEKPRVIVNLGAAKAEGSDFSSRLLSLATIVE